VVIVISFGLVDVHEAGDEDMFREVPVGVTAFDVDKLPARVHISNVVFPSF
jgi:hypothetical protein